MSLNNDRLGIRKNRKNIKVNIPLDMESSNLSKIQKEKINGICTDHDYMCFY